jgi:hypothetical protein
MTGDPAQPYEALASLIERELELVGHRRLDELHVLQETRAALERALPETPPAQAGPALQRCRILHKRVEIELLRVRETLLTELAQVRRAQRAASGYAPVSARPQIVDTSV